VNGSQNFIKARDNKILVKEVILMGRATKNCGCKTKKCGTKKK
jgi:hypothetical protein